MHSPTSGNAIPRDTSTLIPGGGAGGPALQQQHLQGECNYGSLGDLQLPSSVHSAVGGHVNGLSGIEGVSLPSGCPSDAGAPLRPMSRAGSVSFSEFGLETRSRAGSFAQLSRLGSRSSLSVSFEKRETLYRPQDVATLPQKLGELLLSNHARAIDLCAPRQPFTANVHHYLWQCS